MRLKEVAEREGGHRGLTDHLVLVLTPVTPLPPTG